MMKRAHWFGAAFLMGIPMLVVAGVLQWLNPATAGPMPEGFHTPIIALEFVADAAEVDALFGVPQANDLRNAFLLGNAVDYFFMFFYSAFLALVARGAVRETGERLLWVAVVLPVLVFFGDLLENVTLANIISAWHAGESPGASYFGNLHFFTWLKWGGIAVVLLLLAGYFVRSGLLGKAIALVALANFGVAVAAFFHRSVLNEIMALLVVFSFLLLLIFCGMRLFGKAAAAESR